MDAWEAFYNEVKANEHIPDWECKQLRSFIDEKRFETVLADYEAQGVFPVPTLMLVNKKGTEKKRRVFCFDEDHSWFLKMLAWQLGTYDSLFSDNLYSFRKRKSAKTAIKYLTRIPKIGSMYGYKLDIHDYFNSVDTKRILDLLKPVLLGEEKTYQLIEAILCDPMAMDLDRMVTVKKGIMAGTSISPFLANLYLAEVDELFYNRKAIYCRYSDDIILFSEEEVRLEEQKQLLIDELTKRGLSLNPKKICSYKPQEEWEYLGISYQDGVVDLSQVSLEKMKAKMRRKARAIYRWRLRKNATGEQAVKAYIRHFNRKFFDNPKKNEITWCRWYFPMINTTTRLKILDQYMIECIRYVYTGKHSKANFNLRYETIKSYGFRSLVHEYYLPQDDSADFISQ